ncbi:MAG TPA: nucleotidyltransferase domain-containing protein [Pseudobdellovibrionaceae bacterium]|jgi:predicted nucleotidyltransferase
MKFGLKKEHWELVQLKLLAPLKQQKSKVWIFGSRARGDFKEFSDLDVLYQAEVPLPPGLLSRIKEDLEESRLPIKVDLVAKEELASSYLENVSKDLIEI